MSGAAGRRTIAVVLLAGLLAACSLGTRPEPGLFDEPTSRPAAPTRPAPEPDIASSLPVAGDATFVANDGSGLVVRLAVHALRRMPTSPNGLGATVLDWSVTPLGGPGLYRGDFPPGSVELGLSRYGEGGTSIVLVDSRPRHRKVYRPLMVRDSADLEHCLCTPSWFVQHSLQVGRTRLLELVFPALPSDVASVDVVPATVPPLAHVPLTPPGQVPRPLAAVDLARPAEFVPSLASTGEFGYQDRTGGQRYVATIDSIEAAATFTSLRWSVRSVTDGDGLSGLPPIGQGPTSGLPVYDAQSANGPVLRARGRTFTPTVVTFRLTGLDRLECLCTDLRTTSASRQAGQRAELITNFGPLPRGVQTVDVVLPGLPALRDLPVTAAPDSAALLGAPVDAGMPAPTWTYQQRTPPPGWDVTDWPTPLPNPNQFARYESVVDDLR